MKADIIRQFFLEGPGGTTRDCVDYLDSLGIKVRRRYVDKIIRQMKHQGYEVLHDLQENKSRRRKGEF